MTVRNLSMPNRKFLALAFALSLVSVPAMAQDLVASASDVTPPAAEPVAPLVISADVVAAAAQDAAAPPPKAFEYSDAYHTRAKIHKYASFATLPLFVTEGILGQSLYNDPTEGKKSAHLAVATGIGTLFGINTVTGVWNLVDARQDPKGSTRRWVHGLLMLGADAGFLATAATGPGGEEAFTTNDSRSTHRALAFTSISMATAGYLVMLFGGH
jgi:hypothetical protein